MPDPIPMILHCPTCGAQHIDAPEPDKGWTNPPHRSHLCHDCGTTWRPADVPTTGVHHIRTVGKGDTWPPDGITTITAGRVKRDTWPPQASTITAGRNLATAAERYIAAVQATAAAHENGTADHVDDAQADETEAHRALLNAIHQFRKRAGG